MKNKTNLQTSIGNILRENPLALQSYVNALFRNFLTEKFYPELMEKQELLNIHIPPQVVIKAINDILDEEIKNGALQLPEKISRAQIKTIIMIKKSKTR
ncbi:MAG: hypothetical protein E7013_01650 [Alphaproteobacteria bacterium]|nr:hypothetical protein [Alphaproteobacteria bacterium]